MIPNINFPGGGRGSFGDLRSQFPNSNPLQNTNFGGFNSRGSSFSGPGADSNLQGFINEYGEQSLLDSSQIDTLKQGGYNMTPVSMEMEYVVANYDYFEKIVLTNKKIPAFRDPVGNEYIINEQNRVYLIEKSRVNPDTGIPDNVPPPPSTPTPMPGPGPIGPGGNLGSGNIYTAFTIDDIVPDQRETVTRALWTGNVGTLVNFFTSSAQTSEQKRYYYEIWNSSSLADCIAEPQFSVAYGNRLGSGSNDEGGQIEDTPSRAIYGQYRLLCLDQDTEAFTIDGETPEDIYVVNVNRARMLEGLDEGNIELNLAHLSGSEYVAGGGDPDTHTGSAVTLAGNEQVLRLIDDSNLNSATIMQSGEVYKMVSGSIEDGIYNSSNPHVYGLMFKRLGVIVLSADKLDMSASFGTVTGREVAGDNSYKLYTSISGAAEYNDGSGDPLGFQGRGFEVVKSTHYFVRAKNTAYNFSNNPSFVTGSEGDLRHQDMIKDPKTYITTVGLCNQAKDLIAVAKLSQAIKKSFKDEALIKVKLDY